MSNYNDSSDDSFHSASDGEQDSHSTVSTQNSNSLFTSKEDSPDEFVKLTKCKEDITNAPSSITQIFNSNLNQPEEVSKLKTPRKSSLNKENSEEDDDWFKTQMDEFSQKDSSDKEHHTTLIPGKSLKNSKEKQFAKTDEGKTGSIWDWTAIHDVVSAVGNIFL